MAFKCRTLEVKQPKELKTTPKPTFRLDPLVHQHLALRINPGPLLPESQPRPVLVLAVYVILSFTATDKWPPRWLLTGLRSNLGSQTMYVATMTRFPQHITSTHRQYVRLWCSNTVFESRSMMQGCESENNKKKFYNYET
jgi:hypothetical protein